MNKSPFWEEAYRDKDTNVFGKPSREFYDLARMIPKKASVLDLGCGEGRNALFLAQQGYKVTAVDISRAAIEKLKYLANKEGFTIDLAVADIRHFNLENTYDLIVAHGCLHLIERKYSKALIPKLKAATNNGGYNVVAVFTDSIAPPEDLKDFCLGLFKEGELFEFYADWIEYFKDSYVIEEEHPGSPRHRHSLNKIVAQKRINQ